MALTDVAKAPNPLVSLRDRALRGVARASEDPLVHVLFARFAQRLERGGVAAALGQAVAAVAERVRARREPSIRERGVGGESERLTEIGPYVVAHGELVDLVLGHAVQD